AAYALQLIYSLLLVLISCYSFSQSKPVVRKGVLDLRAWNWRQDEIIDLNGQWEFYWNKLYTPSAFDSSKALSPAYINVPDYWNHYIPGSKAFSPGFGFATYRVTILCPSSQEQLALKFLTVASSYKVFVNGKELLNIGKTGISKQSSDADFRPAIIAVQPENNEISLVIQVSNYTFDEGGLWDIIKLGTLHAVNDDYIRNVEQDFFVSGSFFLMGIFYLVMFFFFRRRLSPLYFSIFCLLLTVRPLFTDEIAIRYFVSWGWPVIKHIEFVAFYLTVPVLSLFSYHLLPEEFSKKVLRAILLITAPFVLISLFATPFIFRYPVSIFQFIMFITALYGLYLYIKAVKNKRPGSIYLLAGFIILFITIVNDLLNARLIIETPHLIYAGLFIFTISQAITISKQFFWTYSRLEIANKKLAQINEELNKKNITIVETNDQLSKLNAELDSLVFRTSHDLRSPITSVLTLIEIIRDEEDGAKRNGYLDVQKKILFRLNSLIEGTLDFTKNKRLELKYEPVEFKEFINEALGDHMFAENSKEVLRMVEVYQDGKFYSDKTRLSIIINNLISNALRYHDPKKDKPYLKITIIADAQHAKIEVADNGLGIDQKHLENIFAMFYRADEASRGSGIGLYIVKNAVEKLGGTISVESAVNTGTKFTIDIPNHPVS
ncbi:MAG TPA: 7TM diverse intracellular signaling domain-containing protein, partial [Chitinophagaceae bacterium]|nr:7TM diverse intracellular signaling domain-containing protein [Chitinophagaceae bacterium]